MSQARDDEFEDVERGAVEEANGAAMFEMERELSRPPEERWSGHADTDDDETRGNS